MNPQPQPMKGLERNEKLEEGDFYDGLCASGTIFSSSIGKTPDEIDPSKQFNFFRRAVLAEARKAGIE